MDSEEVSTYGSVALHVYADHPFYDRGAEYSIEWDPGAGNIDPPPESRDEIKGSGTWLAPGSPCETEIKAMATWPNGTKVFRVISITVVEP